MQRVDPRLQPVRKLSSQSYDRKKMNSANNLNVFEVDSPSGPSDKSGRANTLILGFEASEYDIQLTQYCTPLQLLTYRTGS